MRSQPAGAVAQTIFASKTLGADGGAPVAGQKRTELLLTTRAVVTGRVELNPKPRTTLPDGHGTTKQLSELILELDTTSQPETQAPGVGTGVGAGVGAGVGSGVGAGVGSGVGAGLGSGVGAGLGSGVGAGLGSGVGAGLGSGVGAGLGSGVGAGLGSGVGLGVGAGVPTVVVDVGLVVGAGV